MNASSDMQVMGSRREPPDPLDASRVPVAAFWLVLGAVVALLFMWAQAQGAWPSLLRVGGQNPALPRIEAELGPLTPPDPVGHDGQIGYMIARDPFALRGTPAAISAFDPNGPNYRYRRILVPALAGGFGQFGGRLTLLMLIAISALGVGLATVGAADLAYQHRRRGGRALLAIFNVGAIVSAMLLTVDAPALGLTLCSLALYGRGKTSHAAIGMALAALTKETYTLVPLSLAAWEFRQRSGAEARILLAAALPCLLWTAVTSIWLPGVVAGRRALDWPFAGLASAVPAWVARERLPQEIMFAVFAAVTFVGAIITTCRRRGSALQYVMVPWLLLAICSSVLVWGKPHNAARTFALLWPLMLTAGQEAHFRSSAAAGRDDSGAPV